MGDVKSESTMKALIIIALILSCLTGNILGITVSGIALYGFSQKNFFLLNSMMTTYIVVVVFNAIIIFISSFFIIMFHSFSFDDSGPKLIYILPIVLIYGSCAAYHIYLIIKLKDYLNANTNNGNNKMFIAPNVTVQYTNAGSTSTAFAVGSPFHNKTQVVIVQNTTTTTPTTNENPNPNPNPPQTDNKANLSEKSQLQMQQGYENCQYQPPMPQDYGAPQYQPPMPQGNAVPQYQPPMPQGYGAPQYQPPMPQGYGAPQPIPQGYYAPQFQPNVQGQYPTNNPPMDYGLPPYQ